MRWILAAAAVVLLCVFFGWAVRWASSPDRMETSGRWPDRER